MINVKGAWIIVMLYLCALTFPLWPNPWRRLFAEFTVWGLLLAVWIALANNFACNTSYCRVSYGGPRSFIKPCKTIYAAFAFVIVEWLLFTVTFFGAVYVCFFKRDRREDKEAEAAQA